MKNKFVRKVGVLLGLTLACGLSLTAAAAEPAGGGAAEAEAVAVADSEEDVLVGDATAISTGTSTTGALAENGQNWYSFTISKQGYFTVSLSTDAATGMGAGWNLCVYDKDGSTELASVSGITSSGETEKLPFEAGVYYAKVSYSSYNVQPVGITYSLKVNETEDKSWEVEHNDKSSAATSIASGSVYHGNLYKKVLDYDWYLVDVAAGGYVTVSLGTDAKTGFGGGWNLYLYDTDGCTELWTIKGVTSGSETPAMSLPAGKYYIKIDDSDYFNDSTGIDYNLKVTATADSSWESEANDTSSAADTIDVGKTYKGNLYKSEDEDWYAFTTTKQGYLEVTLAPESTADADSMGYYGWNLYFYRDGESEAFASYTDIKTSTTSFKMPFAPGKFYVKVTGQSNDTVSCQTYNLTVTETENTAWEQEPNDTTSTANTIETNTEYIGNLWPYEDVDYFAFTLDDAQNVSVTIDTKYVSNVDDINYGWCWYLYEDGNSEAVASAKNITSTQTSEEVSLSAGKYYLKIRNLYEGYNSSVARTCPYAFSINYTEAASDEDLVRAFVERMYTKALGRDAEEAGLEDWTSRLVNHEVDGAGIAVGFICSDEMTKERNLSNEDFVTVLYQTFFDREPDESGYAGWLSKLESGSSRESVLYGFVMGDEFKNLCDSYGIVRGTMREDGSVVNAGIRAFVERCYTKVLGRDGEETGIEYWVNRIVTGECAAADVAKTGFLFSSEYLEKNTDNETFVETLY